MSGAASRASAGPWRILFRRLRKNRVATFGGIVLFLLYLSSCFAGFVSPYHYADGDRNSSGAGPMLFGGYVQVETEVPSRVGPAGSMAKLVDREWTWFSGGIHFHDSEGNFTLWPHVHPLVELEYRDEYGERKVRPLAAFIGEPGAMLLYGLANVLWAHTRKPPRLQTRRP